MERIRTRRVVPLAALAALVCALALALAPTSALAETMDLDTFITELAENDYVIDGDDYEDGLTVTVTPESGCFQYTTGEDGTISCQCHGCNATSGGAMHTCVACSDSEYGTCYGAATENTPERVNSGLLQFQLLSGTTEAVSISNVDFVYVAAEFTICANSSWAEAITYDEESGTYQGEKSGEIYAAQLYFMNDTDLTLSGCTFDGVVLTHFGTSSTAEFDTTVTDCDFSNIYNAYAIKDIRGQNITVTGCTFTDCGAGIMVSALSSSYSVTSVTISDNTFTNVDTEDTAASDKVGSRGLIQIASSGDYSETTIVLDGNEATDCGPVLRQLNSSFDLSSATGDITGLLDEDGDLTATEDCLSNTTKTDDDGETVYVIATTVTDDDGNVTTVFTYYTVTYQESEDSEEAYAAYSYLAGTTIELLSADDVETAGGCPVASWTDGTTTYEPGAEYTVSSEVTFCAVISHTEADAVTENEVAPTCTTEGSYDSVVYCSVCGEELSRETVVVDPTGHDYSVATWVWSADYSSATLTLECAEGDTGRTTGATVTSTTVEATATEDGSVTYVATATLFGETYTDTKVVVIPATGEEATDGTEDGTDTEAEAVEYVTVYRLYNQWTGEHLFTTDANEYEVLGSIGWTQEGVAWYAATEGTAVYRLYNPYSGEHHYTSDTNEVAVLVSLGWVDEGVAFYSADEDAEGSVAVYRVYNPYEYAFNHHYTTDATEYSVLGVLGWQQEGVAFYALDPEVLGIE